MRSLAGSVCALILLGSVVTGCTAKRDPVVLFEPGYSYYRQAPSASASVQAGPIDPSVVGDDRAIPFTRVVAGRPANGG